MIAFVSKEIDGFRYEDFPHCLHVKKGRCKKSCFSIGYHRAGYVPMMSIFDGGLAGDIAREVCVECGRWFKKTVFFTVKQPRLL